MAVGRPLLLQVVAVVAMRPKLFRTLALVNFESEASPLQGQVLGWNAMSPSMSEGWVGGSDY